MKEYKRPVTITLPFEIIDRMDSLPKKVMPSRSRVIEELLETWLDEQEAKMAETLTIQMKKQVFRKE